MGTGFGPPSLGGLPRVLKASAPMRKLEIVMFFISNSLAKLDGKHPIRAHQNNLGRAVSRILSARVAPRRGSFICCGLTRGLNRFRFGGGPPRALYLALHPMGFAVPPCLRLARWALAPPFHPYPGRSRGGLFSVALSVNPPSRVDCPSVSPAEPGLRGIVSCGVRTFLSQ